MDKSKVVLGICKSRVDVERAVESLKRDGFSTEDISVLAPDTNGPQKLAVKGETKAPEGATVGAGTGAVIGGTLGLLAGVGALAIPGFGPFIAAGPIMAALAGAGVGGAVGGVGGALVGLGIPEYEAKRYESYIKNGGILISIHTETDDQVERAKKCLQLTNATDIYSTDEVKGDWRAATAPFKDVGVDKGPGSIPR